MKTFSPILCILLLILIGSQSAEAQRRRFTPKQRFHVGITTGLNLSQVDGDSFVGYDKTGLMAGLQGVAVLTPRLSLVTELLYTQKGSRVEYKDALHPRKERLLSVNYAEVPFLLRIKLLPPDTEQKQIELETGFSFARLIHSRIEEEPSRVRYPFTDLELDFERHEFNALVGMHIEIFKDFNLGARASIGISKFYVGEERGDVTTIEALIGFQPPPAFFRNYLATIYVNYQLY
ncbi:MAG: porin family protein [Bacteroidota bacterium]